MQRGELLPGGLKHREWQRRVQRRVLLRQWRDDGDWRRDRWPVQRGVLLPRGLADGHGQRRVHGGVLLSRAVRLPQRRVRCGHVRHIAHVLLMRHWRVLPGWFSRRRGCRVYRRQLLRWSRYTAVPLQRRILLPRGRDERDGRRDGRRVQRGVLLLRGLADGHGQRRVHGGVLLPRGRDDGKRRRDRRHMQRWTFLPRGVQHSLWQRRVQRGKILPRWRNDRRGQRQLHRGGLLPRRLRVCERCHGRPHVRHGPKDVHGGVLLPRRLRVRERCPECGHLHAGEGLHVCAGQLLPRGFIGSWRRALHHRVVLHRRRRRTHAVHGGRGAVLCRWRFREHGDSVPRRQLLRR
jgi:hypothetical protein